MRQTFFQELEELEKQEKKEQKEKVELYMRTRSRPFRQIMPVLSIMLIVVLAVSISTYALYLFINISKIGDVADVHVSKELGLAARTLQGKIYNNQSLDIKNWVVFFDKENGFEIRYPESWKYHDHSEHLFEIKKYNSQSSRNESLAAAAFVNKWENEKNIGLADFVSVQTGVGLDKLMQQESSGIAFIRTGKQKDQRGLTYSMIFWERKKTIYSLKVIYYNQRNQVSEQEFNKIFSVLEIKE